MDNYVKNVKRSKCKVNEEQRISRENISHLINRYFRERKSDGLGDIY